MVVVLESSYCVEKTLDGARAVTSNLSYVDYCYVIGVLILIGITIYRREISCNHCYVQEEEEGEVITSSSCASTSSTFGQDEGSRQSSFGETSHNLLRGSSYHCLSNVIWSLQYILPKEFVFRLWDCLHFWWLQAAEDGNLDVLLDGALNVTLGRRPPLSDIIIKTKTMHQEEHYEDIFPDSPLPADALIAIMECLTPRDVLQFSMTNRAIHGLIEQVDNHTSVELWKALFVRDFGWLIHSWNVGKQAVERSFANHEPGSSMLSEYHLYSKDFYFRFQLCFVDYLLAGNCSEDQCLVGLGGHIYDMTPFLEHHPGSPETVLVHAGRDASNVFEGMRHTLPARKRAQQFCIAVDGSRLGGCGVRPTSGLVLDDDEQQEERTRASPRRVDPVEPHGRLVARTNHTLRNVRTAFDREEAVQQRLASRYRSRALDDVHLYYDPFQQSWKAWFIDDAFETVFVNL